MSSASVLKEKIRISKGTMYNADSRIAGIEPFETKLWLVSPTMHDDEQKWVKDAFDKNWITTAGENINEVEKQLAEYIGVNHAIGLSCGTAALHLAIRLAGEKLYGIPKVGHGSLEGHNDHWSQNKKLCFA